MWHIGSPRSVRFSCDFGLIFCVASPPQARKGIMPEQDSLPLPPLSARFRSNSPETRALKEAPRVTSLVEVTASTRVNLQIA